MLAEAGGGNEFIKCYDGITGKELSRQALKEAREKELKYLHGIGVYENVAKHEAVAKYNVTPIDTIWVGTEQRCKYVHELLPESSDALKAILSIAASDSPEFSLMHVDVSRAYFQGHLENCSYEQERSSRNLFHKKKRTTLGLAHEDDFVVTGTKGSLLEFKMELENVYPMKASIIGAGSTKSKALNRRIRWGETGILYQHDPRNADVFVQSLVLENGNTVLTPIIDDVKDENPVRLDSEQIQQTQISCGQMLVPQSEQSRHNIRCELVASAYVKPHASEPCNVEKTRQILGS